jgi:hypothetical protein
MIKCKRSDPGIIKVLSRNLPGRTEENSDLIVLSVLYEFGHESS